MLLLLLVCGSTYLLLGDVQEAIILLIFVVVVIAITLYQERKTERAMEALRDLSSPRALVVRGGVRKRIAGRDVVPDDILVLSEGDRVPADGVLLSAVNLTTDESLLTGESVPVRKQAASSETEMVPPGGDDLPCVFSGTLVVRGVGLALLMPEDSPADSIRGRLAKQHLYSLHTPPPAGLLPCLTRIRGQNVSSVSERAKPRWHRPRMLSGVRKPG
jgi:Ca2+-transporting ATPase